MDETTYHRLADACLRQLMERVEKHDDTIDCELAGGVLTIELPTGKQFVVSKHAISKQVWLSSPVSGGLHFKYDESNGCWVLADGRELETTLEKEIALLVNH